MNVPIAGYERAIGDTLSRKEALKLIADLRALIEGMFVGTNGEPAVSDGTLIWEDVNGQKFTIVVHGGVVMSMSQI